MGSPTGMGAWLEQQAVFRILRERAARIRAQVVQMYRDIRGHEGATKMANLQEKHEQAAKAQEQAVKRSAERILAEREAKTASESAANQEAKEVQKQREQERSRESQPMEMGGGCGGCGGGGNTPPKGKGLGDILRSAIPSRPTPVAVVAAPIKVTVKTAEVTAEKTKAAVDSTQGKGKGMTPGAAKAQAFLQAPPAAPAAGGKAQEKNRSNERGM